LLVIVLAAVGLAALDASGQSFWQGLVINLAIFMILTVSLNLTSGFTGVFSLGQIGFMALGAYISAILTLPLPEKASYLPNLPSWLAAVHLDQRIGPVPVGFLAATALVILPLLSGEGLRALYDRTLGYQAARSSPFSTLPLGLRGMASTKSTERGSL